MVAGSGSRLSADMFGCCCLFLVGVEEGCWAFGGCEDMLVTGVGLELRKPAITFSSMWLGRRDASCSRQGSGVGSEAYIPRDGDAGLSQGLVQGPCGNREYP